MGNKSGKGSKIGNNSPSNKNSKKNRSRTGTTSTNIPTENVGFQASRSRSTTSMNEFSKKNDTLSRCATMTELQSSANLWKIPYEELDFSEGKILGRGSFGCVQLANWRGTQVAVKTLFNQVSLDDSDFINELTILCRLHHPNIVQLIGYSVSDQKECLITEYLQGGSLQDIITKRKETNDIFSLPLFVRIASDICRGMLCLHGERPPIIHRDLKTANILVNSLFLDSPVTVKVADFGISKEHLPSVEHTRYQGTFMYMAPEVFNGMKYTTKVDVFSYSLILWEMITLERPWKDIKHQYQIEEQIVKGNRPPLPNDCIRSIIEVIQDCWQTEPNFRPSFDQILKRLSLMNKDPLSVKKNSCLSSSTGALNDSTLVSTTSQTSVQTFQQQDLQHTNQSQYVNDQTNLSDKKSVFVDENQLLNAFFSDTDKLTWSEFVTRCDEILNADSNHVNRVKPILTKNDNIETNFVTKKSFSDLLKWFNPLKAEEGIYEESEDEVETPGISFSDIDDLFTQPWFHGFIDSTVAAQRLKSRDHGTFLVRFSQTEVGYYAASVNDNGRVRHWKITVHENQHILNSFKFSTLSELVNNFKNNPLESKAGSVMFSQPCPKNIP